MTFDILEARLVRANQMLNMRVEELAIAMPKQVIQVEASKLSLPLCFSF